MIQNSKMRNTGEPSWTMIGRSNHLLDPALLLFDLYHKMYILSRGYPHIYTWNEDSFVFQMASGKPMKSCDYRNIYGVLIHEVGFIDADRLALPHSARKGFASQLVRKGVNQSKIAFAARWYLKHAMFRYLTYRRTELVNLASKYFNSKDLGKSVDFDAEEADCLFTHYKNGPQAILKHYNSFM